MKEPDGWCGYFCVDKSENGLYRVQFTILYKGKLVGTFWNNYEFPCLAEVDFRKVIADKTGTQSKDITTVLEQTTERRNPDSTVLEQAATDTREPAPEQSHWTEEYKVTRYHQEHKYYRYIWMEGRKLHHIHIPGGNVKSAIAIGRMEKVRNAIAINFDLWINSKRQRVKFYHLLPG